jgi:hypothetical protein
MKSVYQSDYMVRHLRLEKPTQGERPHAGKNLVGLGSARLDLAAKPPHNKAIRYASSFR